ncbi:MAG: hypothetical protein BWY06_02312 [Candidatus Latescibacteria bacterium ADurb.Bin168]|nr:MAG: hypothetical protein BWY06_02312 [Candidatus Latescibacteria bacterium ADurb.Bin168]
MKLPRLRGRGNMVRGPLISQALAREAIGWIPACAGMTADMRDASLVSLDPARVRRSQKGCHHGFRNSQKKGRHSREGTCEPCTRDLHKKSDGRRTVIPAQAGIQKPSPSASPSMRGSAVIPACWPAHDANARANRAREIHTMSRTEEVPSFPRRRESTHRLWHPTGSQGRAPTTDATKHVPPKRRRNLADTRVRRYSPLAARRHVSELMAPSSETASRSRQPPARCAHIRHANTHAMK